MSKMANRSNNGPVIAIGLDGAEPTLMQRWMEEGKLPVLRQLQREGSWGLLTRDRDLFSENVWPDFLTGVGASHHGMIAWAQLKPGTYDIEATDAETAFRNERPFYARLNDSDRRVMIVDVPKTRPVEGLKGVQVCAWGAHSHVFHPSSLPVDVYKEIEARFGVYSIRDKDEDDRTDPEYFQELLDGMRTGPERRARMCAYLLDKYGPTDLLLTVFSEPHTVGHRFLHFMDETHPHYDPAAPAAFKGAVFDTYQACDRAIEHILKAVPPNSKVFVFSFHGMAHNSHDIPSMFLLPVFMHRFNFPDSPRVDVNGQAGFIQKLRDLAPVNLRNAIKHRLPLSLRAYVHMKRVGQFMEHERWPQMKAFTLPSASNGYIRINLKGREPNGIVDPHDYDSLCENLTQELMTLIEPRSGKPAVTKVHKRRETHKGPFGEWIMPDLFVEWADLNIESLYSPRFGDLGYMRAERGASHRARGMFLARGAGLPENQLIEGGHARDLTPTLLWLMGEPLREDMDGRVLFYRGAPKSEAITPAAQQM
jgi:predicted AlkP superfamily phosphohydrolase/phosphomutase